MAGNIRFTVWTHRSAESIFGAASGPVNRNGVILTFDDEDRAREECARLNSRSGNPNVRYTVKIETEASDNKVIQPLGTAKKKSRAVIALG